MKKIKHQDKTPVRALAVLAICSFCIAIPGYAQVLTIDDCRSMAQQHNKQIQSRKAQTEQARYTMLSARGNFLPDISLTGNDLWSSQKGELINVPSANLPVLDMSTGSPVQTPNVAYFPGLDIGYKMGNILRGGLTIQQPLYMGGKVAAAYRMYQLAYQISQTQESLTTQEVEVEVCSAYAALVRACQMQQVARQYNALLTELLQNVQSAVRHGMKIRNDELKVQVKLNESELLMRRADNARRLAAMNLCQITGLPLNSAIEVSSEFPVVGEVNTLQDNITGRPEYQMLEDQLTLAHQQVRLSRADMLPQIGVQGSYNYLHGLKVNNQTKLKDGGFAMLLNVSIPIFHFGERSRKVQAAKAKVTQIELDRQHLDEKMLLELSQAQNNLDEARLETVIADKSLEQATENRELSRKQYDFGMETLSDYLEAQALWQQAWQTQVDAHYQLYITYVKYLKAAGKL